MEKIIHVELQRLCTVITSHVPVRCSFNLAIKNYEGMFPFGKQCLSSRETHSYCFFKTLSVVVFEQVASLRCQPGKVTTSCPLAPRWKFVFSSIVTCAAVVLFFQLILKSITFIQHNLCYCFSKEQMSFMCWQR